MKVRVNFVHCVKQKSIRNQLVQTCILVCTAFSAFAQQADPLTIFLNPPDSARIGVDWIWVGNHISKEGITRDLEAMKLQGIMSTVMFHVPDITIDTIHSNNIIKNIPWTPEWWQLVKYALQESKRLGMQFRMFNSPGNKICGGPWMTPELSAQQLVWSRLDRIKGNTHLDTVLLKADIIPEKIENDSSPIRRHLYYKDIAVLAVPSAGIVPVNQVIDITSSMSNDGIVQWDAPQGNWVIYRFGYVNRDTEVNIAQQKYLAPECDMMNKKSVTFHIDHLVQEVKNNFPQFPDSVFTRLVFRDDAEVESDAWTTNLPEAFFSRSGYSLVPYLPAFDKRTIAGVKETKVFFNALDSTKKQLIKEAYYAAISDNQKFLGLINASDNIIEGTLYTNADASQWSESPASIKPVSDSAFCRGVNKLIVHRFVHQPSDQKILPGLTNGPEGIHFDPSQTWWKPARALVKYWERCQGLLQWGRIVIPANDFNAKITEGRGNILRIHRSLNQSHVYFLVNTSSEKIKANCSFDVASLQPELWDPVTGSVRSLHDFTMASGKTEIPLQFEPYQSFFIVFRKDTLEGTPRRSDNFTEMADLLTISGSWKVSFDPAFGGPRKQATFSRLVDWTTSRDNGIRYYSGTAVYSTSFKLSSDNGISKELYFDLGTMNHIAHVFFNDNDLGVVWTAPWMIRLPPYLLKEKNNLRIEVTNVWANRLIGDEQQPPDAEFVQDKNGEGSYLQYYPDWLINNRQRPSKKRFCLTNWNYFTGNSQLVPSGLLGPVKIVYSYH